MKHLWTALILAIALPLAGEIVDFIPYVEWEVKGLQARDNGDFALAEKAYNAMLDQAKQRNDQSWQFRAYFYLGLTNQEHAETVKEADRADALREQAEEWYEKALAVNPKSTATLMNLAEAEWANKDYDDAIEWLQKGLALNDARYSDLALRLGNAYRDLQKPVQAARQYRAAAEAETAGAAHREKLIEFALKTGNAEVMRELTGYIGNLLERNQVDRALDTTFAALEKNCSVCDTPELPRLLVQALTIKGYDPIGFAASSASKSLYRALASSTPHQTRLQQVWDLYAGTLTNAVASPWLGDPADARDFRKLVMSIGASEFRQQRLPRAEHYYTLALQFSPDQADPALLRELAQTYAAQQKYAQVDELVATYDARIRSQQAHASLGEIEDYYKYHRMIASIYDSLSPRDPRHEKSLTAMREATALGTRAGVVEPGMYGDLAQFHLDRGDIRAAYDAQLLRAEAFVREGKLEEARASLAGMPVPRLTDEEKSRFVKLADETIVFQSPTNLTPEVEASLKCGLLLSRVSTIDTNRSIGADLLKRYNAQVDVKSQRLVMTQNGGVDAISYTLPALVPSTDKPEPK